MPEVRFHGRGGQGAVMASRALAEAAFLEGNHVQAFPAFGLERRGAPVMAFTRIQDSPINNHSQIYRPDAVVVLDASLLVLVKVTDGLKENGLILINTSQAPDEIVGMDGFRVAAVNAGAIAAKHGLGSRMSPIVNTAILGAVAGATGYVKLESVLKAIENLVAIKPEKNIAACKEAFESVKCGGIFI